MHEAGVAEEEARLTEPATDLIPRMLKVTAAMGLSAGAVIALSIVRTKVVALELGPEGLGDVTLLVSFLGFAALVLELGLGTSAIREIAAARSDPEQRDEIRRAVYAAAVLLALLGATAIALAAHPIAAGLLGDGSLEGETRVSALGAFAAILSSAALADINAFRRIRSLAKLQPLGGLLATVATGVALVLGVSLVPVVLVAPPVALAVVAYVYARSLPALGPRVPLPRLLRHWRRLVRLGIAFVLNAGLATLGALVLRVLINAKLGRSDTGEFQAAFAVASYYVSFVFAALATDYLPLLSGLAEDAPRMNQAANTQLMVAVLMAAPPVMVLIVAAPLVVPLFYSGAFDETSSLLRIMLLGEVTRVAAWTVGYIMVARSARWLFVATELLYNGLLIALTFALIPALGLKGAGIAYLSCQVGSLLWTLVFARWTSGFLLTRANLAYLAGFAAALAVVYATVVVGGAAHVIAWAVTAGCCYVAFRRLGALAGDGLLTRSSLRALFAPAHSERGG